MKYDKLSESIILIYILFLFFPMIEQNLTYQDFLALLYQFLSDENRKIYCRDNDYVMMLEKLLAIDPKNGRSFSDHEIMEMCAIFRTYLRENEGRPKHPHVDEIQTMLNNIRFDVYTQPCTP